MRRLSLIDPVVRRRWGPRYETSNRSECRFSKAAASTRPLAVSKRTPRPGRWLAMSEPAARRGGVQASRMVLALRLARFPSSLRAFSLDGASAKARCRRVAWWRRRESNPRPKARRRGTLHACPLLGFRARRVEAAKYRQALASVNLAGTRRGATCPPACLMASDPQPPGEVRADVTA